MLSQRIALLSHQFDESPNNWQEQYGGAFIEAVDLFSKDYHFLMQQKMDPTLHTIYFDQGLAERIQLFSAMARSFYKHPSTEGMTELFNHSQAILPDLDRAVNSYQALDEQMTSRLKLIETLILLSALVTLILEALFIFYPSLMELKYSSQKDKIILENSKYAFMNEFFRSIAHQWRQPLTAISLQFENIRELFLFGELTKEQLEEHCRIGKDQIRQLDETIRRVADTSLSDKHHAFNIITAIEHAIQVVGSGTDIRLHGEPFTLHGNVNGFTQVILTILTNSVDAIRERFQSDKRTQGMIDIHVENDDHCLQIRLIDNGTGIPSGNIKRIFEPYFTSKFQSSNKGLSLYIAKKIIEENFAGELEATSEGFSTTMTIRIPTDN